MTVPSESTSEGTTAATASAPPTQIDPPSHLLESGRRIHLPEPSEVERAGYFARRVSGYGLVSAERGGGGASGAAGPEDGAGEGGNGREGEKGAEEGGKEEDAKEGADPSSSASNTTYTSTAKSKSKSEDPEGDDATTTATATAQLHPLAVASSALHHVGISELSKAINLAGLVHASEYVDWTNVVSDEAERTAAASVAKAAKAARAAAERAGRLAEAGRASGGEGKDGNASGGVGGAKGEKADLKVEATHREEDGDGLGLGLDLDPDLATLSSQHRSTYLLSAHHHALTAASTILARHHHRTTLGVTAQSLLDGRLLDLRKRWRLVAPEHGTRVVSAVRGEEVIAVDVEVYDRDRVGGGVVQLGGAGSGGGRGGREGYKGIQMGQIARRVPRFATVELRDGYEIRGEVDERRKRRRLLEKTEGADDKKGTKKEKKEKDGDVQMEDAGAGAGAGADAVQSGPSPSPTTTDRERQDAATIAEPYAVADPQLGKVDLDFDPDQVPLLTLSLSIEKTRTGYAEEVVLSSISSNDQHPDIDPSPTVNTCTPDTTADVCNDERVIYALQHSLFCASLFESMRGELLSAESGSSTAAWLAGGTARTYVPPPTRMDGAASAEGGLGGTIAVVHCHQGEVKVRLDSEYDLTVKLVEAGTVQKKATSSGTTESSRSSTSSSSGDSGSQSPAYLRALCRALLLHAQSSYHDHRLRMHDKAMAVAAAEAAKAVSGIPPGLARRKKDAEEERPLILGGVLALGGKMLLERAVRRTLRKTSRYLARQPDRNRLVVEWLTLSMFDYRSYFTASVGAAFTIDVCIDANAIAVTSFGEGGQYKTVRFGSPEQFEMFLQFQLLRITNGEEKSLTRKQ